MPKREVKPPAKLAPRDDGDDTLSLEELKHISLFAALDLQRLRPEEFPGTIVLRRYRRGETICHENDPGYTAYYPLTRNDLQDLVGLRGGQLRAATERGDQAQVQRLNEHLHSLKDVLPLPAKDGKDAELLPVAAVYINKPLPKRPRLGRGLKSIFRRITGREKPGLKRIATLFEGQLFGEMSCLYRTPRSATIVAERDCYVLEFLRNMLDKMYGNRAFKEQVDTLYRTRVLDTHLRRLPLFAKLPDRIIERLRDKAELREFEPGDLICDENDRSSDAFVIRSGFIKVLKGATFLLSAESIVDWPAWVTALAECERQPPGPRRKAWELLPAEVQALAAETAGKRPLVAAEKDVIVGALNDLLKQPKLWAAGEFKALVAAGGWEAEAKKLPVNPRKWSQHQQVCAFNRRLLGAIFPGLLPPPAVGVPRILAYASVSELIGEMGLLLHKPRSATCIAYDHYGEGKLINGRVEVVRIDQELFEELRRASPELEEEIAQVACEREQQNTARLALPLWEQANTASLAAPFDELGLIQGQKLMLIDLDRCTRCDKCVEACVKSHTQGPLGRLLHGKANQPHLDARSRLFLDGPLFQVADGARVKNYLVPSTCRQCRDPVCLVGCPVGSIHKGPNGQIMIENWCIGCSRCANQCPYGSIQMHAIGIISHGTHGWRIRRLPEGPWNEAQTPFRYDLDWQARLATSTQGKVAIPPEIQLHYEFYLEREDCPTTGAFRLLAQSLAPRLTVQVNGERVLERGSNAPAPKPQKEEEVFLGLECAASADAASGDIDRMPVLRLKRNTVVVNVTPTGNPNDILLDLGLYGVARPAVDESLLGEFSELAVTEKAVVCDMCSEQLGRQPACVNACPHDAAMRVDARCFFPGT